MQLVKYDAMCLAISNCHKIDEVAEMRNQARAIEVYAKQAMNLQAERQAIEIRIRAERKAGQLLKGLSKSKGGQPEKNSENNLKPNAIYQTTRVKTGRI